MCKWGREVVVAVTKSNSSEVENGFEMSGDLPEEGVKRGYRRVTTVSPVEFRGGRDEFPEDAEGRVGHRGYRISKESETSHQIGRFE